MPTEVIKTRSWLVSVGPQPHRWAPHPHIHSAYRNLPLQPVPQDFSWQQDNKGILPKPWSGRTHWPKVCKASGELSHRCWSSVSIGPDSQQSHRLRGVMLGLPHVQSQKKSMEARGQRGEDGEGGRFRGSEVEK